MRTTPYENVNVGTAAPERDSSRVDLFDRIKEKPNLNSATEEKPETSTEPGSENPKGEGGKEEQPEQEPSVTFEEGSDYEDFKEGLKDKLEDFIEDPQEFAEMLVGFIDIARVIFLPGVYEGLMFPGQERNDVREVARKAIENEKTNKPSTEGFNDYDKRLHGKWVELQTSITKVGYDEKDIKLLSKIIARRLKGTTLSEWMAKYDWIIAFAYVEFKHGKAIAGGRAKDFITSKFG